MQHYLFIKLLTIETTRLYQWELAGTICSYFYFTIFPVNPSDMALLSSFQLCELCGPMLQLGCFSFVHFKLYLVSCCNLTITIVINDFPTLFWVGIRINRRQDFILEFRHQITWSKHHSHHVGTYCLTLAAPARGIHCPNGFSLYRWTSRGSRGPTLIHRSWISVISPVYIKCMVKPIQVYGPQFARKSSFSHFEIVANFSAKIIAADGSTNNWA